MRYNLHTRPVPFLQHICWLLLFFLFIYTYIFVYFCHDNSSGKGSGSGSGSPAAEPGSVALWPGPCLCVLAVSSCH